MITADIIATIKEKAEAIPQIRQVFMHPEGADIVEFVGGQPVYKGTRVTQYPALVFVKERFNSDFSDSGSNHRTLAFKGWVLVPCSNTENTDVWERILPNAVDAVIAAFDTGYDFGTVDGHRIWSRMESGLQGYTPEPSGKVAWEELTLIVRHGVDV